MYTRSIKSLRHQYAHRKENRRRSSIKIRAHGALHAQVWGVSLGKKILAESRKKGSEILKHPLWIYCVLRPQNLVTITSRYTSLCQPVGRKDWYVRHFDMLFHQNEMHSMVPENILNIFEEKLPRPVQIDVVIPSAHSHFSQVVQVYKFIQYLVNCRFRTNALNISPYGRP